MFKITLIKNDGSKAINISPIVRAFSWDSDMSLKSVIEFDIIWSNTKYIPKNPVEIGDLVVISFDGEEVNRGIIVSEKRDGKPTIQYTAYDYGWYLSKSSSVYQFKVASAKQAITKILTDFGMPIGNVAEMPTLIDSVFVQKTPAEIITTIIKAHERQSGQKMYSELRKGKMYIESMKDMVIIGKFKLATNLASNNVLDNPIGIERKRSIEDMRNKIKVILSQNDNYETVALAQDIESGAKFGLLEQTFKIDEEDASKARQVSKILLQRLNKIHESNKISLMGDYRFKAMRLFDLKEPLTGSEGRYMITNCNHEVSSEVHTMELSLTLPEDIA